ncbi:MAG TPA: hypothetical protein VF527_16035 [Pyrinomonadaceae bacterium]
MSKAQVGSRAWMRALLGFLAAIGILCVTTRQAQLQTSGDPYPTNSIAYFSTGQCPAGWSPYAPANGLFIVPTPRGGTNGQIFGTPLDNQEPVAHRHTLTDSIKVSETQYVGATGCCAGGLSSCCNKTVTTVGEKRLKGSGDTTDVNTSYSDGGVSYDQLLVCKKSAAPSADAAPPGVIVFVESNTCPVGWASSTLTEGRFLVGLPEGASPSAFGGDPLKSLENREHQHDYSGSLSTDSAGIALTSGCCAKGFGKDGKYTYSGTTRRAGANLPYIQLQLCQKQ